MTRRNVVLIIVGAFLLALPQPAPAQIDTSKPEGQVAQVLRDVRVAAAADDLDGLLEHYWKDQRLVVIDPDNSFKMEGWGAWKLHLENMRLVQKTLFWRTHHRNIHVRGDNAYSTFYVTRQVQRGGTVFQMYERGTYVLRKMEGKWLIVSQHISALPPILRFQQTK